MSNSSTHYSNCFDVSLMLTRSQQHADVLNEAYLKGYHIVLMYSGMSGINHATYLSIALHQRNISFSQIYVRKDNEESHGRLIEYSDTEFKVTEKRRLFVFVDDFIDTGKTLHRIMNRIMRSTKSTDLIYTALFNTKTGNRSLFPRHYRNFEKLYFQLTNQLKPDTI